MNIAENTALFSAFSIFVWIVMVILAVFLFACILRAVIGPRIVDRIVAVNMMGTIVIVMIALLGILLKEDYLFDISLIYAMLSFLAVIMISKVYIGIHEMRKETMNND